MFDFTDDSQLYSACSRSAARAAAASAQVSLNGVVDIHVHADPDSRPRSIDAVDLARMAKARGMRALVLKSH